MSQTPDELDGERGMPNVNSERTSPMGRLVATGGAVLALCVVGYFAYLKFAPAGADQAEKPVAAQSRSLPPVTFVTVPDEEPVVAPEPELKPAKPAPLVPAAQPVKPVPPRKPGKPKRTVDRAASGMMLASNDSRTASASRSSGSANGGNQEASDLFGNSRPQAQGALSESLTATRLDSTSARLMQNRSFVLAQGEFIPCALDSQLNSTKPGITSCTVTRDIYSDDGVTKLVDKASTVTGQYQTGLRQGDALIHVLWTRIKTPAGVLIDIDSPATNSLGATGIPGQVDSKFWKRFGGAILLSLIDDAVVIAGSRGDSNGDVVVNSTAETGSDLAEEVLRNTINIPPTLYANQGAEVGIYIARDLDFSSVYALAAE